MNTAFLIIIFTAFGVASYNQFVFYTSKISEETTSPMELLGVEIINAAGSAVTLAIGLIGVMAFFLGMMKVAENGGLLKVIAKLLRPIMVWLFPDVPSDHPAMGAMIMNISANVLGLGNAATPFGIRAMNELDKLNKNKGTATNAMALFLAINTSGVTLLPTGIISIRAAAGSTNAAGIIPTTLFATLCSTIVAIVVAKALQNYFPIKNENSSQNIVLENKEDDVLPSEASESYPLWVSLIAILFILVLVPLMVIYGKIISAWIVPSLVFSIVAFGFFKKLKVYECFVEGAKDGFNVAIKIIPYLVVILVAIGMFRASGAMDLLIMPLGKLTEPFGMPAEALTMAIMRPLSGSGAYAVVASVINDPSLGPDSYVGYLVSTLQGSTETTFYVMAVYFGAVQVSKVRHALASCLIADLAGIIAATVACLYLFG